MDPGEDPYPEGEEGEGEPGADEEYGEEDGMLDADHPMLDRIQAALTKQLQNNVAGTRVELANKVSCPHAEAWSARVARTCAPLCSHDR